MKRNESCWNSFQQSTISLSEDWFVLFNLVMYCCLLLTNILNELVKNYVVASLMSKYSKLKKLQEK